jgi:hypothetical protein
MMMYVVIVAMVNMCNQLEAWLTEIVKIVKYGMCVEIISPKRGRGLWEYLLGIDAMFV